LNCLPKLAATSSSHSLKEKKAMSQALLDEFLKKVKATFKDFTRKRSSLKDLIDAMEAQVKANKEELPGLQAGLARARGDKRGAKYETDLKWLEQNWGRPKLQYKGPNQKSFTDVTACLYVMKGQSVTIQKIGTTDQKVVSFPNASTADSPAGEQSFQVKFGTVDYTFRAVVYELKPKLTFKDFFAGRSLSDAGIDERLTLEFETVPASLTAADLGGLLWSVKNATGDGTLRRKTYGQVQKSEGDSSGAAIDGTAYYIAPVITDSFSAKNPRPSRLTTTVDLVLTVQAGVMQGVSVEKTLTVHTPQCRMVKANIEKHVSGKPSAGFLGDIFFDPKTVSFKTLKFMEGRGTLIARQTGHPPSKANANMFSGAPAPLPGHPSGYFAFEAQKIHQNTGGGGVTIKQGNSVTGCQIIGQDTVYSGWNPVYPNAYDGTMFPGVKKGLPTNAPSSQRWPIYWKVYPADLGMAEAIVVQQAVHESTMAADGTVTIQKAGATVTKRLNDPTENPS
jgi:hypothetical protein